MGTLHKPFFTWLLLPFLCKTVSEDLICPYTKEALLQMDFIAISYAKLYLRTRFVPSQKKSYFTWRFPFCSTRISKVGKCIAFQLWTPTYFTIVDWYSLCMCPYSIPL